MKAALSGLLIGLAAAGCGEGPPPDSVRLVTTNETGQDLTNFTLRYGTGRMEYQIFCRGCTFSDWAAVREEQPVTVAYVDAAGRSHPLTLRRPLTRAMIGGSYRVTFLPDDAVELRMDWPP